MENCTVCAECDDSPFSISSSAIGIVSIAVNFFIGFLAFLAAVYVRFRLLSKAAREMSRLREESHTRVEISNAKSSTIRELRQDTSPIIRHCLERLETSTTATKDILSHLDKRRKLLVLVWGPFLGIGILDMLYRNKLKETAQQMIVWYDMLNDVLEIRCVRKSGTKFC